MRTSGLKKLFALCLAVISLSMLVSGVLGMRSAAKDRRKNEDEIQDIQEKIDEYRSISALLMDAQSFDALSSTLTSQKEQYERDAAKHKAALAAYTATNSGLKIGTDALNQAKGLLTAGKAQYEAGIEGLETQLKAFEQLRQLAEEGRMLLGTAYTVLDAAGSADYHMKIVLNSLASIGIIMELPSENDADEDAGADETDGQDGGEQPSADADTEGDSGSDGTDTDKNTGNAENGPDPDGLNGGTDEDNVDDGQTEDKSEGFSEEKSGDNETVEETEEKPVTAGGTDGNADGKQAEGTPDENGEQKQLKDADSETAGSETRQDETITDRSTGEGESDPDTAGVKQETETPADDNEMPEAGEESDAVPKSPLTGSYREEEAMRLALEEADTAAEHAEYAIADIETILVILEDQEIPASLISQVLKNAGINSSDDLEKLLASADITLTEEQKNAIDATLREENTALIEKDQLNELRAALEQAERILELYRENADSLTPEQFDTLRQLYADNKEDIDELISNLYDKTEKLDDSLERAQFMIEDAEAALQQLEEASAVIDMALAALDGAGEQIAEGEAALAAGEAQLASMKETQRKKAEELDREKKRLDLERKALQLSMEQSEAQKEHEDREKSLRAALLSRNEIRERTKNGEDLLTAAGAWLKTLTDETARNYKDRSDASLLMIACWILASIGALASFGSGSGRVLSVMSSMLCQAFALSAGLLLHRMGRGISWSSASVLVFATALLACSLPELLPSQQVK